MNGLRLTCHARLWCAFALVALFAGGCNSGSQQTSATSSSSGTSPATKKSDVTRKKGPDGIDEEATPLAPESIAQIEKFCGNCHRVPDSGTNPKSEWQREVTQGFVLYDDTLRTDLERPDRKETLRYFRDRAPDELKFTLAKDVPSSPTNVKFAIVPLDGLQPVSLAGISQIEWEADTRSLVTCDMSSGDVLRWATDTWTSTVITQAMNSCRVTPVDWDKDGGKDYLLADLGSFVAGDHSKGKVQLLKEENGKYRPILLAAELGRTCEAIPFDYDEDGDLDVVVAEFGWRTTGSLFLLRNKGTPGDSPEFEKETIDRRHGALGVSLADFDGNGKQDLLVAYGQEIETVEIFYNHGKGVFENRIVRKSEDPAFGSSWVGAVDIDRDGRPDLLHSNGDSLDRFIPRPYHGVRWLRNNGDGTFEEHPIGLLPGSSQAQAGDIDGDGDLDVVSVALMFGAEKVPDDTFDGVVWFEQKENHQWVKHAVERDDCNYAAVELVDIDNDGRLDIVTGGMGEIARPRPILSVFRNEIRNAK
jgi:hypothetical protein